MVKIFPQCVMCIRDCDETIVLGTGLLSADIKQTKFRESQNPCKIAEKHIHTYTKLAVSRFTTTVFRKNTCAHDFLAPHCYCCQLNCLFFSLLESLHTNTIDT